MGADGPAATAGITLTPCISLSEEKAEIVAAVMTVANSPGLAEPAPYRNNSHSKTQPGPA